MKQPSGFEDPRFPGHVVRLFGSLYGLKRAPQIWHREVVSFFVEELGMRHGRVDPCVFVRSKNGRPIAIVACYVDEELYMKQARGFEDPKFPGHVVRLFGSLYGLRRAPQIWHKEIVNFFVNELGLKQGRVDPCIFVKSVTGEHETSQCVDRPCLGYGKPENTVYTVFW